MAGGKGERLQPLTFTTPKPFLPVAGRPCIGWSLESLRRGGVEDVVITTTYSDDELAPLRSMEHGVRLAYSKEPDAKGTAGGVRFAYDAGSLDADVIVVMSADVVADVEVKALVAEHERSNAVATMALVEVEDPRPFGIVILDGSGKITRFLEKPKEEEIFSNMVNAGIYVLSREAMEQIPSGQKFDFSKDLFPNLLQSGRRMQGARLEGYWKDIGRPEDLLTANLEMGRRIGRRLFGQPSFAPGAVVEESIVYDGVRVEPGAVVRRSLLLPGAHVAQGAMVEESILGPLSSVAPGAQVRACVLGEEAIVTKSERLIGVKRPEPSAEAKERGA